MKTLLHSILTLLVCGLFLMSCEETTHEPQTISGELIDHSSCNGSLKAAEPADSLSCVEYAYDKSSSRLVLKHMNAAFNCCPESLYCRASLKMDTIIVQEFQASNLCKCNCLYDLILVVKGVEARVYFVRLIEPLIGTQAGIGFRIDLAKDSAGRVCVVRRGYLWGG